MFSQKPPMRHKEFQGHIVNHLRREFRVYVNDRLEGVYVGFDAYPVGAKFKIRAGEQTFYSDENSDAVLEQVVRYLTTTYGKFDWLDGHIEFTQIG